MRVEKGPQKVREAQNKWELISRKRKIVIDAESVHQSELKRKKLSRKIQKKTTPIKLKNDQNRWQQKHRLVDSRKKRLNNFKRNTMFNAIFTCLCCHRNLFECNVTKFTSELQTEIETKKPGLYTRSVETIKLITVDINGSKDS